MNLSSYAKVESRLLAVVAVIVIMIRSCICRSAAKAAEKADLAVVNPQTNRWSIRSSEPKGALHGF